MTFAKSCPGSRAIKEPTPEYINCPNCGTEVEVWSHELFYPCHKCGTKVFRKQRPSCIDWCPYAKECLGADLYENLRPSTDKGQAELGECGPLGFIIKEHTEVLNQLGLLRAAVLCLKAGEKASADSPPPREKPLISLTKALEFLDKDLRRHLRREEEMLFPALERHIGKEGGPIQILLREHAELWQWVERLRNAWQKLSSNPDKPAPALINEVYEIGNHIAGLLRGHIEKENTTLLPIAGHSLSEEELKEVSHHWQEVGVL